MQAIYCCPGQLDRNVLLRGWKFVPDKQVLFWQCLLSLTFSLLIFHFKQELEALGSTKTVLCITPEQLMWWVLLHLFLFVLFCFIKGCVCGFETQIILLPSVLRCFSDLVLCFAKFAISYLVLQHDAEMLARNAVLSTAAWCPVTNSWWAPFRVSFSGSGTEREGVSYAGKAVTIQASSVFDPSAGSFSSAICLLILSV